MPGSQVQILKFFKISVKDLTEFLFNSRKIWKSAGKIVPEKAFWTDFKEKAVVWWKNKWRGETKMNRFTVMTEKEIRGVNGGLNRDAIKDP